MTAVDGLVITVDGPAGAGKGAVCRWAAMQFGLLYLETGTLYRAVALVSLREGGLVDEPERLARLGRTMDFVYSANDGRFVASLDGLDVTAMLRQEHVSMEASRVAALGPVRQALLDFQRHYGKGKNRILDGRDTGTVVYPEAQLKIFLTASVEERAKRRALELQGRGETVNLQRVLEEMKVRDARDVNRANAPLVPASDAVVVDSTRMSLEETQHRVAALIGPLLGGRRVNCDLPKPGW